jgi:hypothetical protein
MEKKTFYSPRGGLITVAVPGRIEEVDGRNMRVGEKIIEFRPIGSFSPDPDDPTKQKPPYGMYSTDDPEVIEYIERHRKQLIDAGQTPDILTADEYMAAVVPKSKQIAELQRRLIETQGKLAATLAQQGKLGVSAGAKS